MSGYKVAVYSPSKDLIIYDQNPILVPANELHILGERGRALLELVLSTNDATDWIEQPEWVAV